MTPARQEVKCLGWAAVLGAGLAGFAALGLPAPISAATTERVVTDPHSGLAIGGFDPVAYFTEGAPQLGRPDLELRSAGVTWRFRNPGNRAAFETDPEIYMPRFGGYDPTAVARGASAPGHPELWLIAEERLYLFFSAQARDSFAANPGAVIDAAERGWPAVLRTLVP